MAEEQEQTPTEETPGTEPENTPLQEPPAAPESVVPEEVGAPSEETSTPEEALAAEPPSISGGAPDPAAPVDSPPSQGEGAALPAPEPEQAPLDTGPRVFAFGCPNGQAATFIAEGGHGDGQHAGGPVIPRDVRCPVCGHNMVLREPFDLATAGTLAQEVGAEE